MATSSITKNFVISDIAKFMQKRKKANAGSK